MVQKRGPPLPYPQQKTNCLLQTEISHADKYLGEQCAPEARCHLQFLDTSAHRTWEAAILTCGFHAGGHSSPERLSHLPGVTQQESQGASRLIAETRAGCGLPSLFGSPQPTGRVLRNRSTDTFPGECFHVPVLRAPWGLRQRSSSLWQCRQPRTIRGQSLECGPSLGR